MFGIFWPCFRGNKEIPYDTKLHQCVFANKIVSKPQVVKMRFLNCLLLSKRTCRTLGFHVQWYKKNKNGPGIDDVFLVFFNTNRTSFINYLSNCSVQLLNFIWVLILDFVFFLETIGCLTLKVFVLQKLPISKVTKILQ